MTLYTPISYWQSLTLREMYAWADTAVRLQGEPER